MSRSSAGGNAKQVTADEARRLADISKGSTGRVGVGGSGDHDYNIERTQPDNLLRHDISDEELGALGDMKKAYYWDGM
jgi:hypothetical protein